MVPILGVSHTHSDTVSIMLMDPTLNALEMGPLPSVHSNAEKVHIYNLGTYI